MDTPHLDPRMPSPDRCVLRPILERHATERGDKIFAWFPDRAPWTYADTHRVAAQTANALAKLGVGRGDRVLCWLPNGPDAVRLWFGVNYLGAVYVPINLAYRGTLLAHVIANSGARLMVARGELVGRLEGLDHSALRQVIVLGGAASPVEGLTLLDPGHLDSAVDTPPALDHPIDPWETQSIIYTSGTTGPSKGVLSSYVHLHAMSTATTFIGPDDRYLVMLPLFHVGGTFPLYGMLAHGGSIAVVDGFRTSEFWSIVRRSGATTAIVLGSMAGFLLGQAPSHEDRGHGLRTVTMVPLAEAAVRFRERFGTEIHTHFNMTEISMPLVSEANPPQVGTAGRARAGVELRIVDANDCELPAGVPGELVVRADCPWAINHGYNGDPAATAQAWRNGWFHTGDLFSRDAEGSFFFVDRLKDAMRRRGENVSSFEVESEVLTYPGILEAAAVAVPSPHGEDEILVVVVPAPASEFRPEDLIRYLAQRMPHFMVPRYIWVTAELPKTPTQKVQKHLLRAQALQADLWDREAAGIKFRLERLS